MPIDGSRLIAISLEYAHHASGSGYGHLVREIEFDKVVVPPSGAIAQAYDRWVRATQTYRLISRCTRRRIGTELRYLLAGFSGSRKLVHVLYGEHHSWLLRHIPRNPRSRKVMTIHLPPSLWHVSFKRGQLDRFDAVILMSDSQVQPLRDDLGYNGLVEVIPHGVDTDRFSPPALRNLRSDEIRCTMVGNFLRDYAALAEVARHAAVVSPQVRFDVVASQEAFTPLVGLSNVTHHHRISDRDLVGLYQNSAIGLFLMQDCTANNAVLEAMACGLPIVANDIGGIRTYVDESCAILSSIEPKEVVDVILRLADSPDYRRVSEAARVKAESFSWANTAQTTRNLYKRVIGF